jgi:hypothetical protein
MCLTEHVLAVLSVRMHHVHVLSLRGVHAKYSKHVLSLSMCYVLSVRMHHVLSLSRACHYVHVLRVLSVRMHHVHVLSLRGVHAKYSKHMLVLTKHITTCMCYH